MEGQTKTRPDLQSPVLYIITASSYMYICTYNCVKKLFYFPSFTSSVEGPRIYVYILFLLAICLILIMQMSEHKLPMMGEILSLCKHGGA